MKYLKSFLLGLSLFTIGSAFAQSSISLGNNISLKNNEDNTISIFLQNKNAFTGIEAVVTTTTGLTITNAIKGTRTNVRNDDDEDIYTIDKTSLYHPLIYTTARREIESGEVLKLKVKPEEKFQVGTITIEFTGSDKNSITTILEPLTVTFVSTSFSIGKGGYSSFSSAEALNVEGADVYTGIVSGDKFILAKTEQNVVPANTGVILKSTENSIVSFSLAEDIQAPTHNDLIASVKRTEVEDNSTYVIATGNDGTCFYLYSGNAIPAGKAYLNAGSASKASIRVITNATGIDELECEENAIDAYDLFGNKVENANGQVVIENGKKIIRK